MIIISVENSYLHFYFRIKSRNRNTQKWYININILITLNTTIQKFGVSKKFYYIFLGGDELKDELN